MEKAWDIKALVEEGKAQGLPLLEDSAEKLIAAIYSWGKKSLELESNPIVKTLAAPAIEALFGPEGVAKDFADKIDGKEG